MPDARGQNDIQDEWGWGMDVDMYGMEWLLTRQRWKRDGAFLITLFTSGKNTSNLLIVKRGLK